MTLMSMRDIYINNMYDIYVYVYMCVCIHTHIYNSQPVSCLVISCQFIRSFTSSMISDLTGGLKKSFWGRQQLMLRMLNRALVHACRQQGCADFRAGWTHLRLTDQQDGYLRGALHPSKKISLRSGCHIVAPKWCAAAMPGRQNMFWFDSLKLIVYLNA